MKMFTKLALVSSMAISANAMAMQSMDDAALSAATGQDGINIGIGISKIEIEKLFIHDNDGLSSQDSKGQDIAKGSAGYGGTSTAGAIVIKGNGKSGDVNEKFGVVVTANYNSLLASHNLADITIDSDAGTDGAFLNIGAAVSGLNISIGEIGVTASGTQGSAVNDDGKTSASLIRRGGTASNYNAILSGLSLVTGKMDANIQIGSAPQGAMIKLSTTMQGGLEIKNLGILDNSTNGATYAYDTSSGSAVPVKTNNPGEIFIESIKVADANSKDLAINASVRVFDTSSNSTDKNKGFIQIDSASGPIDNYVKGIHLGARNGGSIGDVEIQGLQTYNTLGGKGSTITISGR